MIIQQTKIEYRGMGLFTTNSKWLHPSRTEITFEIMFITDGCVKIKEEKISYTLNKGDLLVLDMGKHHYGFEESSGKTEFYWLHITDVPPDIPKYCKNFQSGHLFKELLHYSNLPYPPVFAIEAVIAHILAEITNSSHKGSRLSEYIYEWTRINANAELSVFKTANHFGYNNEYISRLMKKNYGMGLKQIIDIFIINKAKSLLCNTDYTSKQISSILRFPESSAFINFFKYHEGITPSTYRNKYTKTHMNNK